MVLVLMQQKTRPSSFPLLLQRGHKLEEQWCPCEQKQWYCTLYFEDDISQDRRIKEQPERSIVQPLYLVRSAVLYSVQLQNNL